MTYPYRALAKDGKQPTGLLNPLKVMFRDGSVYEKIFQRDGMGRKTGHYELRRLTPKVYSHDKRRTQTSPG